MTVTAPLKKAVHFFGGPLADEIQELIETPRELEFPYIDPATMNADYFGAEVIHPDKVTYELQDYRDAKGYLVYLFVGIKGGALA